MPQKFNKDKVSISPGSVSGRADLELCRLYLVFTHKKVLVHVRNILLTLKTLSVVVCATCLPLIGEDVFLIDLCYVCFSVKYTSLVSGYCHFSKFPSSAVAEMDRKNQGFFLGAYAQNSPFGNLPPVPHVSKSQDWFVCKLCYVRM